MNNEETYIYINYLQINQSFRTLKKIYKEAF